GSPTGKKDSPAVRKAGEDFTVKVGVVDANYNLVTGKPADIKVSTPTDSYATVVSTVAINTLLGYTDPPISVTMRTATTHYLSALDFGGSGLIVNHSSTFTVTPNNPVGIQVLMPGEEAVPGSGDYPSGGKTINTSTQTAGTGFVVTVNLVDKYMNRYKGLSVGPTVYAETSDINDIDSSDIALNFGTADISLNVVTKSNSASVKIFPVDDASNYVCSGNLPANTICKNDDEAAKSSFKVYASTATQLVVVLPGESLTEGKCNISPPCKAGIINPGKTASPDYFAIDSGSLFVNVYLVDKFYNTATGYEDAARDTNPRVEVMPEVEIILPQDAKTTPPGDKILETSGFATFTV
ncbi:MAG: hypothetical protein KAI33_10675, partial [Elusimicrobiales bacterium]|nr:hypothetical protein [Elusimicrobiales bacterium]